MTKYKYVEDLLDYLDSSPTALHAVDGVVHRIRSNGFRRLEEGDIWNLEPGDRFYAVRSSSSIIAGIVGTEPLHESGFRIIGAHTDFPGFRAKPCPDRSGDGMGVMAVEVYGGPILGTWFDRDLSLAGSLAVFEGGEVRRIPFQLNEPVCRMASPAIHLSNKMNKEGFKVDAEKNTPLLFSTSGLGFKDLLKHICRAADTDYKLVKDWSIEVYDPQPAVRGGLGGDLIFSGRIDNLAMCHAATEALLRMDAPARTCMICLFNNEEVGSGTLNGAGSRFMDSVMERMAGSREDYFRSVSMSVQVSADGAHGLHPNYKDKYDPSCRPLIGGGPVIKINAKQRYTTTDVTAAYFRACAEKCGVEVQQFVSRNDMPCGSTIGPVTSTRTGMMSVDAGNPMLSMHSVREMAGSGDHDDMIAVLTEHLRGEVFIAT